MVLKDNCGRPLLNLRIALTRKCNLDCCYCHREGEERSSEDARDEMTVEEIVRISRIAIGLGVSRIKLTGGEPLMRGEVAEIVKEISAIPGLADLSLTTNGTLLGSLAEKLRESGLKRVNISLPTLDKKIYHKLTGGRLENALEGVKAAVDAGFYPVKLNMLILKGVNDMAVQEMIEFAKATGTILQLIELEPINIDGAYYDAKHKPLDEYEALLRQKALEIKTRRFMQNRRIYHLSNVKVEVIHPIENTEFCLNCTRIRLTSDGKLKPCLMTNDNTVDIVTHMRNGVKDQELTVLFELANLNRHPYN